MKSLVYFLILGLGSCINQSTQPHEAQHLVSADNAQDIKIENSKYYTTYDTLILTTEIGDTFKYSRIEFNSLIDKHPDLVSDNIQNPDQVYQCRGEKKGFNSEVGQDDYFRLYAYFLKMKNGEKEYAERRRKLINIYLNINSLFQNFQYGGTYFAHQIARILGYAEFSVYLYKQNERYGVSKTYDIIKQKNIYIKSLRQLISDESKIDYNTLGSEKIDRIKELNKIVDDLNNEITDKYYLNRAQEFHYGHYEYH